MAALLNVAYSLRRFGQPLLALAGDLQAVQMAAEVGDQVNVHVGLLRVAEDLHLVGRPAEAEALYRAAFPAFHVIAPHTDRVRAVSRFVALLLDQGRWDEAAAEIAQAEAIMASSPGPVHRASFRRRRLGLADVRVRRAQGRLDAAGVQAELDALLPGADLRQAADIAYWRWRLVGSEETRAAAAELVAQAYALLGFARFQEYHVEVTGTRLPEAKALPDVSALIPEPPDLDTLLGRIRAILPALGLPSALP
jgi:hypothetical protein